MAEAFAWGLIAGSSLLLGGLLALRRPVSQHTHGPVMAFGAGVLISTVAYELVEDAFGIAGGSGAVALGLFAGAFAFCFGDLAIDRFGGEGRKNAAGGQNAGSSLAIVLGPSLLEGGRVSGAREMRSAAQIGAVDLPARGLRMILPCFRVLRDDPISRNDARGRAAPQPSPTNTAHSCTYSDAR